MKLFAIKSAYWIGFWMSYFKTRRKLRPTNRLWL